MTREQIHAFIVKIMRERFEIENPGLDDDLREQHKFDSIDAVELLVHVETLVGRKLTQAEKRSALEIKTLNDVLDYVQRLMKSPAA
jgi:acyl carrier protein